MLFLNTQKIFSSLVFNKCNDFVKNKNLISANDKILIAFSGGADSVYLLNYLLSKQKEFNLKLGIAYFNHGIRKEANNEEKIIKEFFKSNCQKNKINFIGINLLETNLQVCPYIQVFTAKVKNLKIKKSNLQEKARIYRYNFLIKTALEFNFNKVALAHNADDQIETFFINLIRGTGLDGVSGIKEKFILSDITFIRPLLTLTKKEILSFLKNNKISFLQDKSNKKNIYLRNKIRNKLLPYIAKNFSPQINNNILNFLATVKIQKNSFNYFLEELYKKIVIRETSEKIILNTNKILKLSDDLRINILRFCILKLQQQNNKNYFLNPKSFSAKNSLSLNHFILLNNWLKQNKNNSKFFQLPQTYIYKKQNELIISLNKLVQQENNIKLKLPSKIKIPGEYILNDMQLSLNLLNLKNFKLDNLIKKDKKNKNIEYFNAEKISKMLYIRNRKSSDYFYPLGMNKKVKLKNFFINKKIPLEKRSKILLLVNNKDIIWIIGYRIDDRYKVLPNTKKILKVSINPI